MSSAVDLMFVRGQAMVRATGAAGCASCGSVAGGTSRTRCPGAWPRSLRRIGRQLTPPLLESFAQGGDVIRGCLVGREASIRVAVQHGEQVGEDPRVEP